MNSKSLRRLATDHSSLHLDGLPPNYLFPTNSDNSLDNLSHLDVLLTGPQGTAYEGGLWKLHLDIPKEYPSAPPTACFRTTIWHPNVEQTSGSVCVDTLKRDWESKLTLRDILVTISCLLIYPNPASALNAEAGALLQEDFGAFSRRAKLMTSIHARVPKDLREAVATAQNRGEDKSEDMSQEPESSQNPAPSTSISHLSTPPLSSSSSGLGIQLTGSAPISSNSTMSSSTTLDFSIAEDELKENDTTLSRPTRTPTLLRSHIISPRREGRAIPLGELEIIPDLDSRLSQNPFGDCRDIQTPQFSSKENIENNLTPKGKTKLQGQMEERRQTTSRPLFGRNLLRPSTLRPLPSQPSASSTKTKKSGNRSPLRHTGLTPHLSTQGSISKPLNMSPKRKVASVGMKRALEGELVEREALMDEKARKRKAEEDRLWRLCGGSVERWNKGDFGDGWNGLEWL
ncbi:MAG: hypothetical protein M1820_000759 [Bogoriella megaspora]|nr:MAG: hypothetical protein M1820_000759 [Bogoriella megaspora]